MANVPRSETTLLSGDHYTGRDSGRKGPCRGLWPPLQVEAHVDRLLAVLQAEHSWSGLLS